MSHAHSLPRRLALLATVLLGTPAWAQLPPPPAASAPVVNYEYDAKGNPTKTVVAPGVLNFNTSASYDRLDRRKDATNAKNGVSAFQYNGRENLTQVTDPRNLNTLYPRNGLGDATGLTSPDTGTATHTYDAAGNLATRTDSRGVLATYTYDSLNRPTGVVYSKAGSTSRSFGTTYDQTGVGFANGIGRLTTSSFPEGSTKYTYDAQARLTSTVQTVNAATGANSAARTHTASYTYDAAGNVATLTYPSGRVLTLGYTDGQLSAMTLKASAAASAVNLVTGVQWEPFGAAKSWLWQMGAATQAHDRVYDSAGRLVRYRLGNVIRDITYDAADRISAYTHYDAATGAASPTLNQSFGYDELARLTSIVTASTSWTIGYDANGNRTSVTQGASTRAYSTQATSNRLTNLTNPAAAFTYDAAGNIATGNSAASAYTATYALENRLATMKVGNTTTTYAYDAMGQRVRKFGKTVASTVLFAYDQSGHLLGEYDNTGAAIVEYVWLGDEPIAIFTPNGTNPPNVFYIHNDHLGAPRAIVNTANQLRWRWMAEPFATTAPETNPASLGAFTFSPRLPGQYADSETALNYNYFRDYDPSLGRYVQSDPLGVLTSGEMATPALSQLSPRLRAKLTSGMLRLNQPYAYVDNNPVNQIDPDGLEPMTLGRLGLGAMRGGASGSRGGLLGIGLGIGIGVATEMCSPTDRDREERQCDADYDAGQKFCHAMAVTKGRHQGTKKYAETYSQCMRAVEEAYVECYQKAGK